MLASSPLACVATLRLHGRRLPSHRPWQSPRRPARARAASATTRTTAYKYLAFSQCVVNRSNTCRVVRCATDARPRLRACALRKPATCSVVQCSRPGRPPRCGSGRVVDEADEHARQGSSFGNASEVPIHTAVALDSTGDELDLGCLYERRRLAPPWRLEISSIVSNICWLASLTCYTAMRDNSAEVSFDRPRT